MSLRISLLLVALTLVGAIAAATKLIWPFQLGRIAAGWRRVERQPLADSETEWQLTNYGFSVDRVGGRFCFRSARSASGERAPPFAAFETPVEVACALPSHCAQ
jgi:hypothetical protein